MIFQNNVLVPQPPKMFVKGLRKLTTFHDEQYAEESGLYDIYSREDTLVLPPFKNKDRVVYTFLEYSPLMDSSNMTPEDWVKIGKDIEKNYKDYDGFVILHGTDTMAYTASALSFLFDHLGKTVILTGAQVPICEMRSDGRDNLLGALLLAGLTIIPEVCLYFCNQLFRGNRVTKVDAGSFDGFNSPNMPPLAKMDVDININWDIVFRAISTKLHVSTELNCNVGVLRLFPGITAATVRSFLQPPMQGVVLETYGTGNAPNNRPELLDALKEATGRGVIIINTTQCLKGSVSMVYATGEVLFDAGLLCGGDMTPEAVLSKLSYVLAIEELDLETKKKMMIKNLRGEMNEDLAGAKLNLSDSRFIQAIAKSLSISSRKELVAIRDALTPPLACAAAKIGDVEALESIREMGSNLSVGDYDGRTPLHIAACEGHLKVVQYLLDHGSTIHSRDRYGDTPLSNAVFFKREDIVRLLRKSGAHLSQEELAASGTELCSLAARGDLHGLQIWHLAGADLNTPGYDGQTALSVAKGAGKLEAVAYLTSLLSAKDEVKQ